MGTWWRVGSYGVRSFARSGIFAWSTVLLLGLGVGAVTSIFTLVDHVLLRPLPYPDGERLLYVENGNHSGADFEDFHGFASVDGWVASSGEDVNLTGAGEPLELAQAFVTEDFFAFFGGRPAHGRLLVAEDFAASDRVVLSHGTWLRVWGGDPLVVGRSLVLDGDPVTVIGVLDASFQPPEATVEGEDIDLWRPLDRGGSEWADRRYHILNVVGRLAPGRTLADAQREADQLAERRAREFPEQYVTQRGTRSLPLATLLDATVGDVRRGLGLLLGAVSLLLLVACANVAHLFMARGLARSREMAVRRALGASTGAVAGQLLVECLLVAVGGALLGLALAFLGIRAFVALSPLALPRSSDLGADLRILAFATAVSVLTALIFGLLPALRLTRREARDALRAGGRGATLGRRTRRVQGALVALEVALSLVLLTGAGLLLRSFEALHRQELGFRVEGIWTIPLEANLDEDAEGGWPRMEAVREALASVPGAGSATFGLSVPLEFTGGSTCCWRTPVRRESEEEVVPTMMHPVSSDWFTVFEPRFLAGRAWARAEEDGSPPPAVINESLAVQLFGSAPAALGEVLAGFPLQSTGGASDGLDQAGPLFRVVGVIAEDRHYGVDRPHGPALYLPPGAAPFGPFRAHMAVTVTAPTSEMAARLREAIWRVEPDLPVPQVRSMEAWASQATAGTRFDSFVFTAFGAVALLLAAGGLYGTLLYMVGMERRELGIRLALGAAARQVEGGVLARGLRLTLLGTVLGVAGAWAAGRFLESRLYGVEPSDPATLVMAAAALLSTAALASWLPARRITRIDPTEALRAE